MDCVNILNCKTTHLTKTNERNVTILIPMHSCSDVKITSEKVKQIFFS